MKPQPFTLLLERVNANKYLKDYCERIIIIGFVCIIVANRIYNSNHRHDLNTHKQNKLEQQQQRATSSLVLN